MYSSRYFFFFLLANQLFKTKKKDTNAHAHTHEKKKKCIFLPIAGKSLSCVHIKKEK